MAGGSVEASADGAFRRGNGEVFGGDGLRDNAGEERGDGLTGYEAEHSGSLEMRAGKGTRYKDEDREAGEQEGPEESTVPPDGGTGGADAIQRHAAGTGDSRREPGQGSGTGKQTGNLARPANARHRVRLPIIPGSVAALR